MRITPAMTKEKLKHYSLTKSQLSMWTGQKLNPDSPQYNVVHSFDIKGALNSEKFQIAFQELINRVTIFRLIFHEVSGVPYQSELEYLVHEMELVDLSETAEEAKIQDWLKKRSARNLDMSKPLFDTALLKINAERYIWFLNLHHIISDATSSTILYSLMAELYDFSIKERPITTTEIPSFLDYVTHENRENRNEQQKEIESYWKDKIDGHEKTPVFYGENVKNTTSNAERIPIKLGKERSDKLRVLATRTDIRSWTTHLSLFNLFATALFIYLRRVTGEGNLIVGSPSHNRPTKTYKETPGLFIEFFPLMAEIEDTQTYREVLNNIKLETNTYLKYAQPGTSSAAISRSFNVILNYISASFPNFNGMPMQSEWIHPMHSDPAHHLRFHVYDMDASEEITLLFDLNKTIFDDDLSTQVPKHFLAVLDGLLNDIDQSILQPSMTEDVIETPSTNFKTSEELLEFTSIIDQFRNQCKEVPNNTALQYKDRRYTFTEVDIKSDLLASFLMKEGLGDKKRIALFLERSPEYVIAVLAVLKCGGSFIPIGSDQPSERIAYILKDSESTMVLTSDRLKKRIISSELKVIDVASVLDTAQDIEQFSEVNPINVKTIAYIIYTSGSTGYPKGVLVSHGAIFNYLNWAKEAYQINTPFCFPLFTSIGFDLTMTSFFLPLLNGGEMMIYQENAYGPDTTLSEVLTENKVNCIKLTPSHLALIQEMDVSQSKIKMMIVGGEDFKTSLAASIQKSFGQDLIIYNEYGPTEATVGCIVGTYSLEKHKQPSVPIGTPITNVEIHLLDTFQNKVPRGVVGELYVAGAGLAEAYLNSPDLTDKKFVDNPFQEGSKMYATGDLARIDNNGELNYLGRIDDQVKLGGFRIELSDIEANLTSHDGITNAAVVITEAEELIAETEVINCAECGLPSNYPDTDFDANGICHLCNAFEGYKDKAQRYFKTEMELQQILSSKRGQSPHYDCLSLLSGGKDSTYILAQLVNMGLRVLAFTLDNGYISDQAKENIDKIVKKLDVDHIYGETEHMNKIFVDSLQRHQNVCNGCFKTIYTLSTKIALEKEIPFVVTGLSRGQFFETRLTEELFWDETASISTIDDTILEARKLYHREEDAVKSSMDVSMFMDDSTFEKVQFIDFYRYSDVSLEAMLQFLKTKVGWVRPTDTGRSTNCLINQVGIHVHKKQKGYSNYSFPYSWDVRLGHKTRKETLEEINEVIDVPAVERIMQEIGYKEFENENNKRERLVGYYTGETNITQEKLSNHLKKRLPGYMVPSIFKYMPELPLTLNGKVDRAALKNLTDIQLDMDTPFVAPKGEIEELLAEIWKEVLRLKQVSVYDDFIALGGHSLAAIRVTTRINEEVEMNLPLNKIFELPTIASYSKYIEETIMTLLEE